MCLFLIPNDSWVNLSGVDVDDAKPSSQSEFTYHSNYRTLYP